MTAREVDAVVLFAAESNVDRSDNAVVGTRVLLDLGRRAWKAVGEWRANLRSQRASSDMDHFTSPRS